MALRITDENGDLIAEVERDRLKEAFANDKKVREQKASDVRAQEVKQQREQDREFAGMTDAELTKWKRQHGAGY